MIKAKSIIVWPLNNQNFIFEKTKSIMIMIIFPEMKYFWNIKESKDMMNNNII